MRSALLNQTVAQQAIEIVTASLLRASADDIVLMNKPMGAFILLDTSRSADFGGCVIAQHAINPDGWQRDYAHIAGLKAALTFRTGYPSRVVLEEHPYLLQVGDVRYGGSWIEGNLICAFSGVQARFDEWLAKSVIGLVIATCAVMRQDLIDPSPEAVINDNVG